MVMLTRQRQGRRTDRERGGRLLGLLLHVRRRRGHGSLWHGVQYTCVPPSHRASLSLVLVPFSLPDPTPTHPCRTYTLTLRGTHTHPCVCGREERLRLGEALRVVGGDVEGRVQGVRGARAPRVGGGEVLWEGAGREREEG